MQRLVEAAGDSSAAMKISGEDDDDGAGGEVDLYLRSKEVIGAFW